MTSIELILVSLMLFMPNRQANTPDSALVWRNLPDLPRALAGQFVGVIEDHLVVAGGSYFVVSPWDGGKKQWVDTIYTLGRSDHQWQLAGHLPTPLGYGVAITTPQGMLCIGGQTPTENSKWTLYLHIQRGRIVIGRLADLPEAASNMSGALAGDTVYVAGGQLTPQSTKALHSFRALSLSKVHEGWRTLPSWPGPARILPVMIDSGSSVCMLSGAELTGKLGPRGERKYLTDAYCYAPEIGWRKITRLPQPTTGGLGAEAKGKLMVFGGDDGSLADRIYEIKENHPGFSKAAYCYDLQTQEWRTMGTMPYSLVTTGLARWGDELVIAGGEDRPAHRSATVIAGHVLDTGR